ncbi:MAG: SDR family oxidoreductase [Sphingomicrobium sp.]
MSEADPSYWPRVLISGAGGGVGLACAEALEVCGAELVLCDTDGAALNKAAARLGAFSRYCDVAGDNSVAIFASEIAERFTSIDVLINAAGSGYVRTLTMARMTRAFIPLLRRGTGRRMIINIAANDEAVSTDGMFPYASSPGAFEQLSEALAVDVKGTSIEVVTVVPRRLCASLGNSCSLNPLYQLRGVDRASTANWVASLLFQNRDRRRA